MRYHEFEVASSYSVALLCKESAFDRHALTQNYVNPLVGRGIPANAQVAFTLDYDAKKVSAKFAKAYLDELMPELKELGVTHLYCADANYFKLLAGQQKADVHMGYVLPCKWKGCEDMHVTLGVNYQQLVYDPALEVKKDAGLQALANHLQGSYQAPGTGIIHQAVYPEGLESIQEALFQLLAYDELTADIEAFSLRFNEAGIGTIAFAVDQHRGVAFACDYLANTEAMKAAEKLIAPDIVERRNEHGRFVPNAPVRAALKSFFEAFVAKGGKLTWHHAGYDVKVLIYTLWMKHLWDTEGLLEGLDVLARLGAIDDTKIIAYLATNSCAGNVLGLKPLAHEFAGNWAKDDIKDIRLIPLQDLLQYNLVDALSTWYVKNKYMPVMIADQQQPIYQELMLPSQRLILQTELTGMPMSRKKIAEVKATLEGIRDECLAVIRGNPILKPFEDVMTERAWARDFEERKAKAKNPDKIKEKDFATFPRHVFNPNSGPQLQVLLFEMLALPVLDLTETKQPATGGETLEKLINHTSNPAIKALLEAVMNHGQVVKILNTFIPAFEEGLHKEGDPEDIIWLFGSFNLGGTVSGRLSSSDPNLQNIPANVTMMYKGQEIHLGKLVKTVFVSPPGKVFFGADFNSLEDYISALTTKDPAKLDVYIRGFDGHSLRAAYYFREELIAEGINIDLDDPKSVNVLKKIGHWSRQESKGPTFALTYQGTYHTLMTNLGWSKDKAQRIEANYHVLYKVSDEYIAARLRQANKDGYVTVAFGLRLRTPLIQQVVWQGPRMPYEAAAEGRTAGNAMGQSYGLLNNRAAVEFWKKVWASPFKHAIHPCALIHDAIYGVCAEKIEAVQFVNTELIKSMQWQELPEIQHPTVKLGANLDLYWPDWAHPITLPNDASNDDIIKLCKEAV